MNCPSCGVVLTGKVCACGYAVRLDKAPVVAPTFRSEPSAVIRKKMAEKLKEVNAYVAEYKMKNSGTTKRDACLDYLSSKGIRHMLPKHLVIEEKQRKSFDDAMDNYRAENS